MIYSTKEKNCEAEDIQMKQWRFRKFFAVLLALCLTVGVMPLTAEAAVDYVLYSTAGGYLRVNQHNGTLTDCSTLSGELVIPSVVEGITVTSIAERAFYGQDKLTSVTVPSTVKTVGDQAFTSCLALKTVVLNEGVETLGKNAFRYCYSLSKVTLPTTLQKIDDNAFQRCLALKSITVPNGVDSIGKNVFDGCENLTTVSLPATVMSIGEYAFSGCKKLTSINLPTGITALNTALFDGCTALEQVIVPNGVQRIYSLAFRNCSSLQKLSLPDSIQGIDGKAFDGCNDNMTFYVNAGSYAQAFASANGISFQLGTLSSGSSNNNNGTTEPSTYPETPFTDVKGHWAKEYIEWAYYHSYFNGESATKFQPNVSMDRAMLVTVLYNIENRPTVSTMSSFKDVKSNAYYADPVAWAAKNGIVTGYEDNTFRPTQKITRQEMAIMLYNYAKYKGMSLSAKGDLSQFKDNSKVASYAGTQMSWAVGSGIIGGIGNGLLDPRGEATRAQGTVMLKKFLEL